MLPVPPQPLLLVPASYQWPQTRLGHPQTSPSWWCAPRHSWSSWRTPGRLAPREAPEVGGELWCGVWGDIILSPTTQQQQAWLQPRPKSTGQGCCGKDILTSRLPWALSQACIKSDTAPELQASFRNSGWGSRTSMHAIHSCPPSSPKDLGWAPLPFWAPLSSRVKLG